MIKKLFPMMAAAVCLSLASACTPSLPPEPVEAVSLADEKALYAAEAAYFGVASTVEAAVDAGLLRGEEAGRVALVMQGAYDGLVVARRAQALGDFVLAGRASREVLNKVADIQRLLRPVPG